MEINKKKPAALIAVLICLIITVSATSCGKESQSVNTEPPPSPTDTIDEAPPPDTPPDTPPPPAQPSYTPTFPAPGQELVPYDGAVEHIFFHEVIAYPELAFSGSSRQKGYDDYMVTVSEYIKILESLYRNNYILVSMNDVWSEYSDENGTQRMRRNTLMLPEGKKPLIISFDDINFYEYMHSDGFMQKLIIGEDGEIWTTGADPDGNTVVTQDLAAVPILDKFVKDNPDFSMYGVKGCIALTGYEGILGYRTQNDRNNDSAEFRLNRMQEIARVRPVIDRLKKTGWYFASHSYGHISLDTSSFDSVSADAARWMDEVGPLVGETQIFIYPFGSRLDGNDVNSTGPAFRFYHDLGFRLFASVGYEPFSLIKTDIAAVVCDRMNVDGIALRRSREQYLRFYDAREVFDPMRPAEYGIGW